MITCLACDGRNWRIDFDPSLDPEEFCLACGNRWSRAPGAAVLRPADKLDPPQPFAPPVQFKPRPDVDPHCARCFATEARQWQETQIGVYCDDCWEANERRWRAESWQQPPESWPTYCEEELEPGDYDYEPEKKCGRLCIHPPDKKDPRNLCGGAYCKRRF